MAGEVRALEHRIQALLDAGWPQVQVVTDHGWLMLPAGLPKVELPEHLTVVRKGRCARLKPGVSVDGLTVPWYWDADARIALAPGIACYEAGTEYSHGGLSPQESFVPTLVVARAGASTGPAVTIADITWRGLRCAVRLAGATPALRVDIRSKAADPAASLATSPRAPGADGTVSLLVEDEDRLGQAALVVVLAPDGTPCAQMPTTIGG